MSDSEKCPRCKSDDRAKRGWVQPFPGFANEGCEHPWHGKGAGLSLLQHVVSESDMTAVK